VVKHEHHIYSWCHSNVSSVLALDSWLAYRVHYPFIRSNSWIEKWWGSSPVHGFTFVIWVSLSDLTLLARWQEGHPTASFIPPKKFSIWGPNIQKQVVKVIWWKAALHPSWRRIHSFRAGDNATTAQAANELTFRREGWQVGRHVLSPTLWLKVTYPLPKAASFDTFSLVAPQP